MKTKIYDGGIHKVTVEERGLYSLVTFYEKMGDRWVRLGNGELWDTHEALELVR